MPKELEYAVIGLVTDILKASTAATPDWLVRPGRAECGEHWPLVRSVYSELTGLELPDEMRKVERCTVDAVLVVPGSPPHILEVDEKQHFNADLWIARSNAKSKLEAGTASVRSGTP